MEERRKQKHHKPSRRKQKSSAAIAELDLKLQNLLLDINLGSNAEVQDSIPSPSRPIMPAKALVDPGLVSSSSNAFDFDFIDLVSPSPAIRGRVDVICLSDSETETSPEHERKARDLRLFLSSIRD